MNIIRDVAAGLFKMFVGDALLTAGTLVMVAVAGLLTRAGVVPPLFGGAVLFVGTTAVLAASVVLSSRRLRTR